LGTTPPRISTDKRPVTDEGDALSTMDEVEVASGSVDKTSGARMAAVDPACKLTLDSITIRMRLAHGGRNGNRATVA
jgi:hypothetical protein